MKFNNLNATVFPSEEKTIAVNEDPIYNGAHRYRLQNCYGFPNGKTLYSESPELPESKIVINHEVPHQKFHIIQFVKVHEDKSVTPGLQSEQLILMLIDRHEKLNARFPSPHHEKIMAGLRMALEAMEERVRERMDRGVMGELKK